jgi:hypothetical protein
MQHKFTTLVDVMQSAETEFDQLQQFQFSGFTVLDIPLTFAQIPCSDSSAMMLLNPRCQMFGFSKCLRFNQHSTNPQCLVLEPRTKVDSRLHCGTINGLKINNARCDLLGTMKGDRQPCGDLFQPAPLARQVSLHCSLFLARLVDVINEQRSRGGTEFQGYRL